MTTGASGTRPVWNPYLHIQVKDTGLVIILRDRGQNGGHTGARRPAEQTPARANAYWLSERGVQHAVMRAIAKPATGHPLAHALLRLLAGGSIRDRA
jgi:hypothetical protein